MDENKSPQNLLEEIMNRPPDTPSPDSYPPPKFKPLPPDDDVPLPSLKVPKAQTGPDWAAKLLPWLCLVLGAALLVMGICVLQVVGMNARLDGLQSAVEAVQSIDSLREETGQLQAEVEEQQARAEQAELEREYFRADRDQITQMLNVATIYKWQRDYLFYIGRFMDSGDYPMAAMVVGLSAWRYFSMAAEHSDISNNPAQWEQYQAYCQELLDRGYLKEPSSGMMMYGGANVELAGEYDPSQSPDMAALGILWCTLEQYYVYSNPDAAAQHIVNYQQYALGDPGVPFSQRIQDAASVYALQQYEQLIATLIEDQYLVEKDGVLDYPPNYDQNMAYYPLPFSPPTPPNP